MENKEIARKMGEEAQKRVDPEFSVEEMVRKIETLYQELISRKAKTAH